MFSENVQNIQKVKKNTFSRMPILLKYSQAFLIYLFNVYFKKRNERKNKKTVEFFRRKKPGAVGISPQTWHSDGKLQPRP